MSTSSRRPSPAPPERSWRMPASKSSLVIGKLIDNHSEEFNKGFDSAKGEYVDMIQAGILDPVKVVRTGLIDASGVASLLGTTEVAIVDALRTSLMSPAWVAWVGHGRHGRDGRRCKTPTLDGRPRILDLIRRQN